MSDYAREWQGTTNVKPPPNLTAAPDIVYEIVWKTFHTDVSEIEVAGIEARYYVRAGLSPEPLNLTPILRPAYHNTTWFLTPEQRRRVADAALRGWVDHHPGEPSPVFAYHRHMAGASIQISQEKP